LRPDLGTYLRAITAGPATDGNRRTCSSPQARTPRTADAHVRSSLWALTEGREAASTKAVALASTPELLLQAWSSHIDPAHNGRHTQEGAPLRTIAFVSSPPDGLRSQRRPYDEADPSRPARERTIAFI
jgi:hypothetical protein